MYGLDAAEIIQATNENSLPTPLSSTSLKEPSQNINSNIILREIARLENENFKSNLKINSILRINDANYLSLIVDLQE